MTKIEVFAKEQMGITLTLLQVEMIRRWSVGATIVVPKRAGVTTAKQVYYRYLQDAVKPIETEIAKEF
jgi:hypothetical protein